MPAQSHTRFDLIVIGGGAVGSHVAEECASSGMTVALVEKDQLGGTCLNYGCDPMNRMVRTGEVMRLARPAERFGIDIPDVRLDWPALRGRIAAMIEEIRGGDGAENLREKGIEFVHGHATFLSDHEIDVDGRLLSADRFVIAAGSATVVPSIEGLDDTGYLTHTDMFTLEELPQSIVILGEGSIAVEFAQTYLNFGLDVTLVTPEPRILPGEEPCLAEELGMLLRRDGLVLRTSTRVTGATVSGTGRKCVLVESSDGGSDGIDAEEILVATDRRPRVHDLGLDAAHVVRSDNGIQVDTTMRTTAPHFWAVGDITGVHPYTHVAHYQGDIALDHILDRSPRREADYRVIPWKVFTQPEPARVGMTEDEARAEDYDVVISTMTYQDLPRALTLDERDGLVKLVVDRTTHEVLGGHLLGAQASEVIGEIALVMRHRLPVSAIADTIHTHPTMSEAVYWAARNLAEGELAGTTPAAR